MESTRGSLQEWIHASLEAGMDEAGSILSFAQCFSAQVGLALRRSEARRCVKATAKSGARLQWIDDSHALFLPKNRNFILPLLLEPISQDLSRIARRPLTAKELLLALPISNKERLRWTKDGRLVQQGAALMKRGQTIALKTYAVAPVQALLADPAEIQRWREQDLWLETR